MPENKPFVVNDRRKFTAEGELRPDAAPSEPKAPRPEAQPEAFGGPVAMPAPQPAQEPPTAPPQPQPQAASAEPTSDTDEPSADQLPPPPTAEQTSQATSAYDATVARLDTAIRATNPGMEPIPEMTFERVIQSLYMQAILQLGGGTEPGQPPQVDILGARQTIDMLSVIEGKTKGNLSDSESKLIDSALFESRMAFLEVTQALARQAAARPQPGVPGMPGAPSPTGSPTAPGGGGPRIVR